MKQVIKKGVPVIAEFNCPLCKECWLTDEYTLFGLAEGGHELHDTCATCKTMSQGVKQSNK